MDDVRTLAAIPPRLSGRVVSIGVGSAIVPVAAFSGPAPVTPFPSELVARESA
ncbi:hypothetical protein [Modestobacter roseus]|uniref:Uncharacterized protein n=1 Tax=Modestobacter roseus TaxID=1181884 RepID=A0A562IVJ7_9ACTN|nr:hypothetical protein [Modestobacter roseus]TWH74860.1 hypothetical protein JD78_03405 [Modestobacter roseus]